MPDQTARLAEPRVIGVVGAIPDGLRQRIVGERPGWVEHELADPHLLLLSRGRTHAWTGPDARGIHWSGQGQAGPVSGWQQAMHETVAAGVAVTPDEVVLHTSSWGNQALYVAWLDPTTLAFSTTSEALLDLLEGPLDPDWDAWASILTSNNPINGRTPFLQVRRLRGGEHHRLDVRTGTFSTGLDAHRFISEERSPADPGEIVDGLRTALTEHPVLTGGAPDGDYLASLPLTGGWDSRLLGAIAGEHFGPEAFLALTTSKHTENVDPDVTYATTLAQLLGITQEIIHPDRSANPAYTARTMTLLEYETWEHSWFGPAASVLMARGLPVIDGFAGDTQLKNAYANRRLFTADPADVSDELWRKLDRRPALGLPAASESVRDELEQRMRPDVEATRQGVEGHPNEGRIAVLRSRIMSGVGLAPFKLLATGVEVVTPFLHPAVTSATMSIPAEAKASGALSRQVLEAAMPGLSGLPSTNDPGAMAARGRRRTNGPEARAWTAERLDVLDRFIGHGFAAEDVEVLHGKPADAWRHRLIQLSCWLEAYESRLSSTTPPWWGR